MISNIKESENYVVYLNGEIYPQARIICIGYNNFKYIKGMNIFRMQDFYTVHFILSGEGTLLIGGKQYALKKGDVFFCPPDESFSYFPTEENPWEYVWISLKGEGVLDMVCSCGFNVENPTRLNAADGEVKESLERFFDASLLGGRQVEYRAYAAWFNILSGLSGDTPAPAAREELSRKMHVKHALDCIHSNYTNPEFKVGHIPQLIFVSHSYLCRIFLKETGTPIIGYLKSHRIKKAAKLLKETDISVKEAALNCGYGDYSHFCKTFLKIYGMTPTEYRNSKT